MLWTLEGAAENGDISLLRVWIIRRFLFLALSAASASHWTSYGIWKTGAPFETVDLEGGVAGNRPTERMAPRAQGRLPALLAVYGATAVPSRS